MGKVSCELSQLAYIIKVVAKLHPNFSMFNQADCYIESLPHIKVVVVTGELKWPYPAAFLALTEIEYTVLGLRPVSCHVMLFSTSTTDGCPP